jgi:hypothetical protein
MPTEQDNLSRAKDWLTITAIVVGAACALWTFVFDKVLVPNHAPQRNCYRMLTNCLNWENDVGD